MGGRGFLGAILEIEKKFFLQNFRQKKKKIFWKICGGLCLGFLGLLLSKKKSLKPKTKKKPSPKGKKTPFRVSFSGTFIKRKNPRVRGDFFFLKGRDVAKFYLHRVGGGGRPRGRFFFRGERCGWVTQKGTC